MNINQAKQKTNLLQEMLPTVKNILQDLFVCANQMDRFLDFATEVVAIADAEIAYTENMSQRIEEMKWNNQRA